MYWDACWSTEGDGLDTGVVRLFGNLAGHEGLPDSPISSLPQKCLLKIPDGINNTSLHLLH